MQSEISNHNKTVQYALGALAVFALIVAVVVGSTLWSDYRPSVVTKEKATRPLVFDGVNWTLTGVPTLHGDVSRPFMKSREYASDQPGIRVIEFYGSLPAPGITEGVYKRILQRQIRDGDTWISDGPGESWTLEGKYCISHSSRGELDGPYQVWHKNGHLQLNQFYKNGKRTGPGFGLDDTGRILWIAHYQNDVEVSGQSYDADGNSR